jgi:flagellar basal-body rod modification protein FlgD
MSSINSLSSILNSNTNAVESASSSTTNASTQLTPTDFINFMVTELQNQDPLDPTDSNQMLQQMSEIGQLQSQDSLQTSLTGMVQQNQVAAASNMIGKLVAGTDANSNSISGVVSAVQVTSSGVNLQLSTGDTMSMANVTAITNAPTSTTPGS